MMNNDDFSRNSGPMQQGRKPYPQKYQDNRYSPSTNYNYGYGHNTGYNGQQHPRRRADRFKRESLNYNDRLSRQNDMIIRLLKEIRDRLPPPPVPPSYDNETDAAASQNGAVEMETVEKAEAGELREMPQEAAAAPDPSFAEPEAEQPQEEKGVQPE